MAGRVQLALLLVIAVFAHSNAAPFADEQNPPSDQSIEHTANLDKEFDNFLPTLHKYIIKNGLDPMQLIDVSESLLPDLPGMFKGHIELTHGWAQNLAKVKRSDHVLLKYTDDRMLIFDMDLGFDVMDFNYEYDIKYLLLHRHGDMYCRLFNLKTKVVVTVDLNERHISLDTLKFTKVEKYDVKFEGHLLDPVLNAATKVVTTLFKTSVLSLIEERAFKIFTTKLDEWNKIWKDSPAMTAEFEKMDRINALHPNNLRIDTFDVKLNLLDLKLD